MENVGENGAVLGKAKSGTVGTWKRTVEYAKQMDNTNLAHSGKLVISMPINQSLTTTSSDHSPPLSFLSSR